MGIFRVSQQGQPKVSLYSLHCLIPLMRVQFVGVPHSLCRAKAANQHLRVFITAFVLRAPGSCAVMLCPASYRNMAFPCLLPVEMGRKFPHVLGNDRTQPLFEPL